MKGYQFAKLLFIGWVALLLFGCNSTGQSFKETGIQKSLTLTLDTYLDANLDDDDAGMAIMVIKDGELVYRNAKGMANKNIGLSIGNDTAFRLASVSKPFTAMAVMQLYEQQKVSFDMPIITILPELSFAWQDITIDHLLRHQSGIPDFLNDLKLDDWIDDLTNQMVLDHFSVYDQLEFIPGSRSEYSNSGYLLLAEIIERVSGERFEDYMMNHFFEPFGMTDSYINDEYSSPRVNDALNYATQTTLFGHSSYNVNGSTGQVSSLNDIENFIKVLFQGQVVSSETINLYANRINHDGSSDGFRTLMVLFQQENWQLVILANDGLATTDHVYVHKLVVDYYKAQKTSD